MFFFLIRIIFPRAATEQSSNVRMTPSPLHSSLSVFPLSSPFPSPSLRIAVNIITIIIDNCSIIVRILPIINIYVSIIIVKFNNCNSYFILSLLKSDNYIVVMYKITYNALTMFYIELFTHTHTHTSSCHLQQCHIVCFVFICML